MEELIVTSFRLVANVNFKMNQEHRIAMGMEKDKRDIQEHSFVTFAA